MNGVTKEQKKYFRCLVNSTNNTEIFEIKEIQQIGEDLFLVSYIDGDVLPVIVDKSGKEIDPFIPELIYNKEFKKEI